MPGFALVYGALILDEPITASTLGGLALILVGVALGSGAVRLLAARRDAPCADARRDASRSGAPRGRRRSTSSPSSYADEDVRPFLAAAGAYDRDGVAARSRARRGARRGRRASWSSSTASARARWPGNATTAAAGSPTSSGFAVHPPFRGRRLADEAARLLQRHLIHELGFHRIQLEIYGFNERAQRHAERAGFMREGVKRKAYRRGDGWVDGVLYALVEEDLDDRGRSSVAHPPEEGRGGGCRRSRPRLGW